MAESQGEIDQHLSKSLRLNQGDTGRVFWRDVDQCRPRHVRYSLAESQGFLKAPGGAPANVACAITKLGSTSAVIGKVIGLLNHRVFRRDDQFLPRHVRYLLDQFRPGNFAPI